MTKGWWQPPQLRIGDSSEAERHATWLELFFDLVFVVAIAQLAHRLSQDISLSGFFGFLALFVPVWWSWIGAAFYATRFDTDDPGHRFLTGLQMVAIAAMAVNIHHGLGESSAGFALSYAAVRAVLVVEYLRAGRHIAAARPLTNRFARGFGFAAALWLLSAFVPLPFRFGLWALGLIVDFATPLGAGRLHTDLAPHASHLPERFGLFTIIVLGELIVAVVNGVAEEQWNIFSVVTAVLGLSIAFSLGWVYFDNLDGAAIQCARTTRRIEVYQTWLYAHLPLAVGLTTTGVGVEHAIVGAVTGVLGDGELWLFCGGVALCLVAFAMIHLTTGTPGTSQNRRVQAGSRLGAAAFVVVLAIAGKDLLPPVLTALVAAACALQIVLEQSRLVTNSMRGDESK